MVGEVGLEPTRIATLDPKSSEWLFDNHSWGLTHLANRPLVQ